MPCPLPIDWLELLEGRPATADYRHLQSCLSCLTICRRLRDVVGVELASWTGSAESAPRWRETRPRRARDGELWLTHATLPGHYDLDTRLIVLVLFQERRGRRRWLSCAPVDTTLEQATSVDMALRADESDLAVPLLVLFRHQLPLARVQLGSRLGRLTDSGQRLVADTIAGVYDESRWGPPLTGPDDERLAYIRKLEPVVRALGSYYSCYGPT